MVSELQISGMALIRAAQAGTTRIAAVFGGQGSKNLGLLDELRDLYHLYSSVLDELIYHACSTLDHLVARSESTTFQDEVRFDLAAWLSDPQAAPDRETLAQAPISFPLNTILALAHYTVTCRALDLLPGEVGSFLCGVTGHSQGIFAAMAIAQANDWKSFYLSSSSVLELSFLVGEEAQHHRPASAISAATVKECIDQGEGRPSSMLSVSELALTEVEDVVALENRGVPAASPCQVHVAVVNSRDKIVLAGTSQSLYGVVKRLRRMKAPSGLDQSRVLFNQRKATIAAEFLPISAPFHTPLLSEVAKRVLSRFRSPPVLGHGLHTPLLRTSDGRNLQEYGVMDVIPHVVRAVVVEPVNWPATLKALRADYILDFGPGCTARLAREVATGAGVRIIQMTDYSPPQPSSTVGVRAELFSAETPLRSRSWEQVFAPRLVRNSHGQTRLQSKMTELFRAPPVMVAGMTPTTVPWDVVAAITNAGYHVELAGGGYHDPQEFELALRKLASAIPPHRGITCNLLYANPKSIAWQISVLKHLIEEGVPIQGITIGAGVPSLDVVREWVETIGIRHISFKPGSHAAIDRVIEIAQLHPNFPIVLQWTGGRAGGHHSLEDFERPILGSYSRIRACQNIVLVAGSGFGGTQDSVAYLTGKWAHKFGFPSMPFDGILLGSRMMVAKEAHTAMAAKQLIVQAPGVSDANWHTTFDKPTGGIITIRSEMGEPIHMLATRGTMLWKEFDEQIFSIPEPARRLEYLHNHRDYIITRLNADYVRPWFAVNRHEKNVELEDMTYLEVIHRMCRLMSTSRRHEWIHISYLQLIQDFIREISFRLGRSIDDLSDDPRKIPQEFERKFGHQATESVYPEDSMILISLFLRGGQKPVPFIPRLDEHFETWFKKDTLWQSENIEAVIDQDVQRVSIIHGPVAARFSISVDEPAKTILDSICQSYVQVLERGRIAPQEGAFDPLPPFEPNWERFPGIQISGTAGTTVYTYLPSGSVPPLQDVIDHIARSTGPWARACLSRDRVFVGSRQMKNPIRAAFRPQAGDTIHIVNDELDELKEVKFTQRNSRSGTYSQSSLHLIFRNSETVVVKMVVGGRISSDTPSVAFEFTLESEDGMIELHEVTSSRNDRITKFYSSLWLCPSRQLAHGSSLNPLYYGNEQEITREGVNAFTDVIAQSSPPEMQSWKPEGYVPLDYCVVIAWEALVQPLLSPKICCDLLRLLHVSIDFKYSERASPLEIGQIVKTESRISARAQQSAGQMIEVSACITRKGEPVVVIKTKFLIQDHRQDQYEPFSVVAEPHMVLNVDSEVFAAVVKSRRWLHLVDGQQDIIGKKLLFRLTSHTTYSANGVPESLRVWGSVLDSPASGGAIELGHVDFEEAPCLGNPVTDFLRRYGAPVVRHVDLTLPGWTAGATVDVTAPSASTAYARVSRDANPIHVSNIFARYTELPGTILHGMHTSAIVRRCVEWAIGDSSRARFRHWQANFHAPVHQKDRLQVQLQHKAMAQGQMSLKVQVIKVDDGSRVMSAEATVEQASTAYVFTGQGSQRPGMGMELYASDPLVKSLWDRADRYLQTEYGFSLLKIVRENPKILTVSFRGKRGRKVRTNYLAMLGNSVPTNNNIVGEWPTVEGLDSRSTSYTFRKPNGLLYSTQFAQPALVIMEMAEFEHLKGKGLVQQGAQFAGHSLGEYAALGAFTSFMPFESFLDLVYYRAFKMQNAINRDNRGETGYSMMAVDPSRIGRYFGEACLRQLVQLIQVHSKVLLEIVNYNVTGRQYVCAGHVKSLWVLSKICDELATLESPHLLDLQVMEAAVRVQLMRAPDPTHNLLLSNGTATVPLAGIDIPFHSRLLHRHIDEYRQYLHGKIRAKDILPCDLIGRWIPNVVGRPFSLDAAYIKLVQEKTGSLELMKLIESLN